MPAAKSFLLEDDDGPALAGLPAEVVADLGLGPDGPPSAPSPSAKSKGVPEGFEAAGRDDKDDGGAVPMIEQLHRDVDLRGALVASVGRHAALAGCCACSRRRRAHADVRRM